MKNLINASMGTEETRAALIASFEADIASLTTTMESLDNGALSSFIVMVHGLPINYDGKPGTIGGMVTTVAKATRFVDEAQAERMAAKTVNGQGERGEVWTLAMAFVDSIERIRDCIKSLKAGE